MFVDTDAKAHTDTCERARVLMLTRAYLCEDTHAKAAHVLECAHT